MPKKLTTISLVLVLFLVFTVYTKININFSISGKGEPSSAPKSDPICRIENEIVYDVNGMKITTVGFNESGMWGPEIKVIIENSTEKDLLFSGYDYVVNGITLEGSAHIAVNAGTKAAGSIFLLESELETAGIESIATVAAYDFSAYDADTYNVMHNISFEIRTSIVDTYKQAIPPHENILFQQDGITISPCGIAETAMYHSIVLMITNEYGEDILVSSDKVSVNGFTISTYAGDAICKDTVRFWRIDIPNRYLNDCSINSIENATFSLEIKDVGLNKVIAETGDLQIFLKN
ncbi:MAG: hypothetical protein IJO04_05235 [Oscillospiraceae bacterium]|nr:hypothetical protein [Oscillospiraceae bacterium]